MFSTQYVALTVAKDMMEGSNYILLSVILLTYITPRGPMTTADSILSSSTIHNLASQEHGKPLPGQVVLPGPLRHHTPSKSP